MKIAIIGTGNIGGTLGRRWLAAGHEVTHGSRDGAGQGPGGARQTAVGDAIAGADVVVLAVPGRAEKLTHFSVVSISRVVARIGMTGSQQGGP
ncbi:MAG TPA: NAD(P)-binding domain-containing protein [Streptosporangiaceae bacterium]|nr:NAD(P)-binding domain-containing protein [Streptosporangiaceae bacterium]